MAPESNQRVSKKQKPWQQQRFKDVYMLVVSGDLSELNFISAERVRLS